MTYSALPTPDIVRRDEDGADIAIDADTADASAYRTWLAAGNAPTPAPIPAAPVPDAISDRQFVQQLAVEGKITEDEALAYVSTGALPNSLSTLVAQLPAEQQFDAKMKIIGAHAFMRADPLTAEIGQLYGMSGPDIDAFWTAAAQI